MKKLAFLQETRWLAGLAVVLVLAVALQSKSVLDGRRRAREVGHEIDITSAQIRVLERRLDAKRSGLEEEAGEQGRGPGGIRSAWDDVLFDGPTAARSALELAFAAEESGFRLLKYEGQGPRTLGTFPPDRGDDTDEAEEQSIPVRGRYEFVEWPIQCYVESDWPSILALMERLTESQPGFSIREWTLAIVRDDRGRVVDRLSLAAELSTFWIAREDGA